MINNNGEVIYGTEIQGFVLDSGEVLAHHPKAKTKMELVEAVLKEKGNAGFGIGGAVVARVPVMMTYVEK